LVSCPDCLPKCQLYYESEWQYNRTTDIEGITQVNTYTHVNPENAMQENTDQEKNL
jgi:hypothetical protein